jgi:hypothetical protein
MPLLFGRSIPFHHPAHKTLTAIKNSGPPGTEAEAVGKAKAANLKYDVRVSAERANAAHLDWISPDTLASSYNKYFQTKIRNALSPDFTLRHNQENIVYGAGLANRLHGGLSLLALFNTRGLHDVYCLACKNSWHDASGKRLFQGYPKDAVATSDQVFRWVNRRMLDSSRRRELIDGTLKFLTTQLAHGAPYHPTWCGFYHELAGRTQERWPTSWGLGHWLVDQRWWFAVCYKVNRTKTLAVPTVLDALNPLFFVAPPVAESGHPVDVSHAGGRLTAEFIHPQIELSIRDHDEAGGVYGLTQPAAVILRKSRLDHWDRLNERYGYYMDIGSWIAKKAAV